VTREPEGDASPERSARARSWAVPGGWL